MPVRRCVWIITFALLVASVGGSVGCRKPGKVEAVVTEVGRTTGTAPVPHQTLDAWLDGRLHLVGVDGPGSVHVGERARFTLYFLVEKECAGTEPMVFVHVAAPGAEVNQASADHKLLGGRVSLAESKPGDLLVDTFEVTVPSTIAVDELQVWAGLYQGKERWHVTPKEAHDGKDRIEIGRLHVDGAPPFLLEADVHQRTGPITLDGKLDEPDWQKAAVLGPFTSWDGKTPIERKTTARLLWDPENLWLAFEGEDPDVFTPYKERDDPLYDSEAVEIFIDADGDKDVYVELQAAPANDLHFDAAFAGGRRKNMDKGYNAAYESKTVVDEKGFVSEWRIPVKDIKDVPAGEPKSGATWRINLFRLERVRSPDHARVVKNEASAWSTPLSGDFHNLDRFGEIHFVQ